MTEKGKTTTHIRVSKKLRKELNVIKGNHLSEFGENISFDDIINKLIEFKNDNLENKDDIDSITKWKNYANSLSKIVGEK